MSKKHINTRWFRTFAGFISHVNRKHAESHGIIWRGQRDSAWPLRPSLARLCIRDAAAKGVTEASTISSRLERYHRKERQAFEEGLNAFDVSRHSLREGAKEALLQHHGGKSLLLDWTASPYVAAFFAFADVALTESEDRLQTRVAIWGLDVGSTKDAEQEENRRRLAAQPHHKEERDLIPEPLGASEARFRYVTANIPENQRIISQQGAFTSFNCDNSNDIDKWVRQLPPEEGKPWPHLHKLMLPSTIYDDALTVLNKMNINYATLFPDLHGAALHATLDGILGNYRGTNPSTTGGWPA